MISPSVLSYYLSFRFEYTKVDVFEVHPSITEQQIHSYKQQRCQDYYFSLLPITPKPQSFKI